MPTMVYLLLVHLVALTNSVDPSPFAPLTLAPIPVVVLGKCTEDLETLLLNTSLVPNGDKILSAWGLGQGDLGSYSICASYATLKYHYCWMGTDITRAIGLCVPSSCTANVILDNIDIIVKVIEHLNYNSTLDIFKTGCTEIDPFDTGAIITTSIMGTLLLLLLVSSIASWRKRCFQCMERGCDCVGAGNRSQLDYWNWGRSLQHTNAYDSMHRHRVSFGGAGDSAHRPDQGETKHGNPNQQNSDSDTGVGNGTLHFPSRSRRPSRPTVPPHMVGSGSEFAAKRKSGPNQSDSDVEQPETKHRGHRGYRENTSSSLEAPLLSPVTLGHTVPDGIDATHGLDHPARHRFNSSVGANPKADDSCLLKISSIIINSFSLKATYRQLCAKDRRPLAPLHSLRVLATLWIILGNVVVYMMPVIRNLGTCLFGGVVVWWCGGVVVWWCVGGVVGVVVWRFVMPRKTCPCCMDPHPPPTQQGQRLASGT